MGINTRMITFSVNFGKLSIFDLKKKIVST